MGKITAILVDDEKLALNRMANLLKLFPNVEVIHKEFQPETAIEHIVKLKPDIVYLDIEMPGMTGFALIEKVRKQFVFPTFIIVTAYDQYAIKAIKKEAFDYLVKPIDIDDLRDCLERYNQKQNHFPHIENSCLSEREKEVARLICKGKTSLQIGEKLFISKNTVDTHRRRILKKLEIGSTIDLINLNH
ncbi:MAG: response regulator transcription factor [Prolixibacteraceae bacterium]|nr:response regulator transcription factor [Prolixibacteraceae bacterium]